MDLIKSNYSIKKIVSESLLYWIYLAVSERTGKTVFVVSYKPDVLNRGLISDLMDLAERVMLLRHPHLMRLIDTHYDGDSYFLIYEFDENLMSLDVYLNSQSSWTYSQIKDILRQVLDGLIYVSSRSLNYLNLNLESIYITKDKSIRLCAPQFTALVLQENINTISIIEESNFLSPEFYLENNQSASVDIFAFGVLAYFLYTGTWPFKPCLTVKELKKAAIKYLQSPSKFQKNFPKDVEQLILTCLQYDRFKRFQSISELYAAFHKKQSIQQIDSEINASSHVETVRELKESLVQDRSSEKRQFLKDCFLVIVPIILCAVIYIYYLSSTQSSQTILTPDVVGLSLPDAKNRLKRASLKGVNVDTRFHPTIPEGHVVEMKPQANRKVKENREIRLFISKGAYVVDIDNFIGMNIDDVLKTVDEKELALNIIDEQYSLFYDKGTVISQTLDTQESMSLNTSLGIVLSKGYPVQFRLSKNHDFSIHDLAFNLSFWIPKDTPAVRVKCLVYIGSYSYELFFIIIFQEKEDAIFHVQKDSRLELFFDDVLVLKKWIK